MHFSVTFTFYRRRGAAALRWSGAQGKASFGTELILNEARTLQHTQHMRHISVNLPPTMSCLMYSRALRLQAGLQARDRAGLEQGLDDSLQDTEAHHTGREQARM